MRLTEENLPSFEVGVGLQDLPQTFRDAIFFTSRLGVQYIWIDSLCIKQGHAGDWLHESVNMHKVYTHSFCNLSATAARDIRDGLFLNREVNPLWESEVNLDTAGIPGTDGSTLVQTYAIIDPLFWDLSVDNAVLNSRGWVLQERLMAPRVLHFCQQEDAAECYLDGLSSLRLSEFRRGEVVPRSRLKGLDPDFDGRALRNARLKIEPVPHLVPGIYAFELWKRVVEVYSKARLTNLEDKIIALTGIAKLMSDKIGSRYVAGMSEQTSPLDIC